MGILQLSKVIKKHASNAIVLRPMEYFNGKTIAIDASMSIYQFLIAIRSDGVMLSGGETTSHLVGMFYRTIRLVEKGIKILYVFDGKPPEIKIQEIEKRNIRRAEAEEKYKEAEKDGDKELMAKFDKRKVKVGKIHVDECKKLLTLMGIPFVTAPSEAEAFCAYLAHKNIVYGVGTEDMDALTFGAPRLLRNLNAAESKKLPVEEYNLDKILSQLDMKMEEFIDMCIILGCDYTQSLKGVGPQKAVTFIRKYKKIEEILKHEKYTAVENWEYKNARLIFNTLGKEDAPLPNLDIRWNEINLQNINEYLVKEKQFDEERVKKGIERLFKGKKKAKQGSLDDFFRK
ncbi:FEN1-like protein [Spraguea lophii 42_110]|uniref:Flap endonuclease 1 n=1 Tax=Spraguea lophii (strain 42_110) TaxID=1358809 RepID=S7WB01_SPRLO|nr:FEN1-like protein [Spraguea lophii 42_110]